MPHDPRVDAYIDRARPFAQPILGHIRERVHALLPEADETLKWSMPTFVLGKSNILLMAAFKAHATLTFWRGREIGDGSSKPGAMGQFGRIASLDDLPPDLDERIAEAGRLAREVPPPARRKASPKPVPDMHPDFAKALAAVPAASNFFESSSPSCRREYLEWIAEAKREETRARRISKAVEQLGEGRKLNWKYEKC